MKWAWIVFFAMILFSFSFCSGDGKKKSDKLDAKGLLVKGKRLYIYCQACHETTTAETIKVGPHLVGIMNRKVASLDNFVYSDSLSQKNFVWNVENMTEWIKQPAKMVPGTTMVFAGLSEQDQIDALMAYLKTL